MSVTEKITELTPEQIGEMTRVRDEWLAHGTSTDPANRPEAELGVQAAYRYADLEPPELVHWVNSPLEGAVAATLLAEFAPRLDRPALKKADRTSEENQLIGRVAADLIDPLVDMLWESLQASFQ